MLRAVCVIRVGPVTSWSVHDEGSTIPSSWSVYDEGSTSWMTTGGVGSTMHDEGSTMHDEGSTGLGDPQRCCARTLVQNEGGVRARPRRPNPRRLTRPAPAQVAELSGLQHALKLAEHLKQCPQGPTQAVRARWILQSGTASLRAPFRAPKRGGLRSLRTLGLG